LARQALAFSYFAPYLARKRSTQKIHGAAVKLAQYLEIT
jgi:hypothetical protein